MTVTSANYPNESNFPFRRDACLALQKVARICSDKFRKIIFEANPKYNISCKEIMKANNTLDMCNENDFLNNNPKIIDEQKLMKFLISY